MRSTIPLIALTAALALPSSACDDASGTERSCGPGTTEVNSVCTSSLACGAGTVAEDGQCVPGEGGLRCGAGTRNEGGVCVRLADPVTCGTGTAEVDGVCARTEPPLTCGLGTELDENGEACVATNPLVCGAGTTVAEDQCVSDPCSSETVEQDGQCVPFELADGSSLSGLCPRFGRNVCESLARCACASDEEPGLAPWAADPDYCAAYVENAICGNLDALLWFAVGSGQFEPATEAIEAFVEGFVADESCEIDVPSFITPGGVFTYTFDLVDPAVAESEPCSSTLACIDTAMVCRPPSPPEPGEPVCLDPVAEGLGCTASAQCEPTLYCATVDDTCQPRPVLTQACSGAVPCTEGACCRDGSCVALPGDGDVCCAGGVCGGDGALYCADGLCTPFAVVDEPCTDVACRPDLLCADFGDGVACHDRMPFCELAARLAR